MVTTHTKMLDTLAGSSFSTTQLSDASRDALLYLGLTDGDSDEKDMAAAILAFKMLHNQRLSNLGRDDPSLLSQVRTPDELMTPEIERLLGEADKATDIRAFKFKLIPTSKHWSG